MMKIMINKGDFMNNFNNDMFEQKVVKCDKHGDILSIGFKGKVKCSNCVAEAEAIEKKRKEDLQEQDKKDHLAKMIRIRLDASKIPPRFQQHSFDNYIATTEEQKKNKALIINYAINFESNLKNGSSVILCGGVGTGKTHLACSVGTYIIKNLGKKALFISAIDALTKIKETYSKKSETTEIEAINSFLDADLLILDEFGVQVGSETEKLILFRILNRRYEYMKPTILITNFTYQEIKKFEERIYDRLKDNGTIINFNGKSYRKITKSK